MTQGELLRHLHTFHAVAASGGVSQPAVGQAIARLEADLGQPVFVRSPGRTAPTELGLRWIARFARVLEEVRGLRRELADLSGTSA